LKAMAAAALDDAIETQLSHLRPQSGEQPADAAEALSRALDMAAASFCMADVATALLAQASMDARAGAESVTMLREEALAVRERFDLLPERERSLLQQVYFEGKTIEEAGATIGLSKSWSSRLHARALERLRESMVVPATE
jgi:RNA polymerase sigma factor (sigma-70 family)